MRGQAGPNTKPVRHHRSDGSPGPAISAGPEAGINALFGATLSEASRVDGGLRPARAVFRVAEQQNSVVTCIAHLRRM